MTSKALATLNRKTRIVQACRTGLPYREIAAAAGCSHQLVSAFALAAGIRRRRNGKPVATPADKSHVGDGKGPAV